MWQVLPQYLVLWVAEAIRNIPARDDMAPLSLYAIALILWWLVLFAAVPRRGSARALALGLTASSPSRCPAWPPPSPTHQRAAVWQGRTATPSRWGLWLISGYALDRNPASVATLPCAEHRSASARGWSFFVSWVRPS